MLKSKLIKTQISRLLQVKLLLAVAIAVTVPLMLVTALMFVYDMYQNRIFPGIAVANMQIGDKTAEEAAYFLKEHVSNNSPIVLASQDQTFELTPELLELSFDYNQTATTALKHGKSDNVVNFFIAMFSTYRDKPSLPLIYTLNEEKLNESVSILAGQVATEPIYPSAKLSGDTIIIEKGRAGQDVSTDQLVSQIKEILVTNTSREIQIPVKQIDPTLTEMEIEKFRARANTFIGKTADISFEKTLVSITDAEIIAFLEPSGFSEEKVKIIIDKAATRIDRPVQNAVFRFENGMVQEFLPAKIGVTVDKEKTKQILLQKLLELEATDEKNVAVEAIINSVEPTVTTKEVNDLGINELIGRGESTYKGSIASRIHNVGLAASKFNGVLVEPGQTVSFNDVLGDVSALTGYKPAYVIQDGKTVLGDGGGVCQVSTTFFRAALNAGLPIVERRAHSYRVTYYEQGAAPGLDATVYSPTTDFKIKNDTPKHILIQTINDPKTTHLVFEIYGTSDGRKATITKPIVTSVAPPPEDLYIDDPTLPTGQTKQIDWKAWGAKVTFDYIVERNGEVLIKKTFVSNYRPWQAKFLRGTGPTN